MKEEGLDRLGTNIFARKEGDGCEALQCQSYLFHKFLSKKDSNTLLGCLHTICRLLFTYALIFSALENCI